MSLHRPLTVGSLCSGIGGIDLGLERAGMKVAWQCEHDPRSKKPFRPQFNQIILNKHWPGAELYGNIEQIQTDDLERVDIIAAGFSCQDISQAGKGAGITGPRSGLFFEVMRIVRVLRPSYVLLENVPLLRKRGLDAVLRELYLCGHDAEWDTVSALSVGAFYRDQEGINRGHGRDRMFIVAYPNGGGLVHRQAQEYAAEGRFDALGEPFSSGKDVADACPIDVHYGGHGASALRRERYPEAEIFRSKPRRSVHWNVEPDMGRVAHGIPHRVDRLRALGNAVVHQVAEFVGRSIVGSLEAVA